MAKISNLEELSKKAKISPLRCSIIIYKPSREGRIHRHLRQPHQERGRQGDKGENDDIDRQKPGDFNYETLKSEFVFGGFFITLTPNNPTKQLMMKKTLHFVMAALCAVLLVGCGPQSKNKDPYAHIQAIVFQWELNGKKGLINLNGEVLVEPQFDRITMASCNRFFAKNDDEQWRLYTLEYPPRRVGDDGYLEVGRFVEGLCPVVKPGACPEYIDVDGHTVFGVNEYNGKNIDRAFNFQDGLARVMNEDGLFGFVDKTGKMVIEPQYDYIRYNFRYGKAIVYKPQEGGHDIWADQDWAVIDREGNELFASNTGKMNPVSHFGPNDVMIVSTGYGMKFMTINSKGEKVAMLDIDDIWWAFDDRIVYYAGDLDNRKMGMMDLEGNVIIEPQYEDLEWKGGPAFATDDNRKFFVLDQKGQVVNTLHKYAACLFDDDIIGYRDRMLWFTDSTYSRCYLADAQGNKLPSSNSFHHMIYSGYYDEVHTDYRIIDRFVSELNLSTDGMAGIEMGTSAKVFDELDCALIGEYSHPKGNLYQHENDSYISNLGYSLEVMFTDNYYNEGNRSKINGNATVGMITLFVVKEGAGDAIYNALLEKIKGLGELVEKDIELDNGLIVDLYETNSHYYLVIGKLDDGAVLLME